LAAHKSSERSIHYGPSEVVHTEDFDGGKYYLCKYDKWVSCNTVNRTWLFFWSFGNQPTGFENDRSKPIAYTWSMSYQRNKAYGIINDDRITKVEIVFMDGSSLTETHIYEKLFLFTWISEEYGFQTIKGYDKDNNLIYEEQVMG
jgi:hypothetical protein